GTLAYQDAWGLFDQIMISYPWLNKDQAGLFFYQQHIFFKEYMVENKGRYKGYPMRTWDGNTYRGGCSDHFPTYIIFLKKIEPAKKGF
ncbi:MAG TPA: endonuclease/exonuclease/phosphatase, partial [Chitinophagaceae bacterium]